MTTDRAKALLNLAVEKDQSATEKAQQAFKEELKPAKKPEAPVVMTSRAGVGVGLKQMSIQVSNDERTTLLEIRTRLMAEFGANVSFSDVYSAALETFNALSVNEKADAIAKLRLARSKD